MAGNICKQNINSNPAVQQIGPNQTFAVRINRNAFLRPLAQPLFDTELHTNGETDLSFFGRPYKSVVLDQDKFRKAKTRSVLKLIEWGLLKDTLPIEVPDTRAMASPSSAREGRVDSGDVILGVDRDNKIRRALVLCPNEFLFYNPDQSGCVRSGLHVLYAEGDRWGKRVKKLSIAAVREAYDLAGPEICMALEAKASEDPVVKMAGEAKKLSI